MQAWSVHDTAMALTTDTTPVKLHLVLRHLHGLPATLHAAAAVIHTTTIPSCMSQPHVLVLAHNFVYTSPPAPIQLLLGAKQKCQTQVKARVSNSGLRHL